MTRDAPDPQAISIGELAERADVSRRTIRFYIQRGLLQPPLGGGRGSHYTEHHLERLLAVKRMQELGVPLESILQRLGPPDGEPPVEPRPPREPTSPEAWRRHTLAPGVELLVRDDALTASALDDLVRTARLIVRRDQLDNDP
jgi:DNA-binding transcriptional MerR regulator